MKIKKIIYIIAIALVFTGCDNFLSKTPNNRADLSTPRDIAALLVSAYPSYNHVWFSEVRSDNNTDVGPTAAADEAFVRQSYYWERVETLNQNTPDGYFFSCYTAIAASNHSLAAMEEILKAGTYSEEALNPYKGEALVARAYNHFMLVNLFAEHYDPNTAETTSGIPYVTTVEDRPLVEYDQLSVAEVYRLIEKDLLEGLPLISDQAYEGREKWHFNRKAAYTFASRYYLYRGLPNDWDQVIYYANLALENNPAAFLRDWLSTYDLSFDAFGTEYSRSTNRANFLIQSNISTMTRAWYHRYTMDVDLMRYRVNSVVPHPINSNNFDYILRYKSGGNTTLGCYSVFKFVEVFKRDGVNANFGMPYVMYTPIVAEEALFNLMEAYTMTNNFTEVVNLFNIYYRTRIRDYSALNHRVTNSTIMNKYGGVNAGRYPDITPHFSMTDQQKAYLRCIVNVRASEFSAEGHRWFDIKRMHIVVNHAIHPNSSMTLSANDPRRIIDMPVDATRFMNDLTNAGSAQLESDQQAIEPQAYVWTNEKEEKETLIN